jgi:hypothetical protein
LRGTVIREKSAVAVLGRKPHARVEQEVEQSDMRHQNDFRRDGPGNHLGTAVLLRNTRVGVGPEVRLFRLALREEYARPRM